LSESQKRNKRAFFIDENRRDWFFFYRKPMKQSFKKCLEIIHFYTFENV
jgi:hypothetical protein